MNPISYRLAAVALCMSVLSACASVPRNPETVAHAASGEQSDNTSLAKWLTVVGETKQGDVLALPVSGALGKGDIRVGRQYKAASGRTCKHMLPNNGQFAARIACRQPSGQWLLVRSLFNSNMQRISRPVTSNASVPVNLHEALVKAQTETVEEAYVKSSLQHNETLWSFAQRTTGNGMNWQSIAEINAVDDVQLLDAGTILIVPQAMFTGQR